MNSLPQIILFLFLTINLSAQGEQRIVPYFENGKWGFMNKEQETIVPPKYEEAYTCYNDLCRVKIDGKYGFINRKGRSVISAKFDTATDFSWNASHVTRKGKEYKINRKGRKYRAKKKYWHCNLQNCCSYYWLREDKSIFEGNGKSGMVWRRSIKKRTEYYQIIDTLPAIFDTIVSLDNTMFYFVKDSKVAIFDKKAINKRKKYTVDDLQFVYEDVKKFPCVTCGKGYLRTYALKEKGMWGYIGSTFGSSINFKPKYISVNAFSNNGYAFVEFEKGKFGYIDRSGREYFKRMQGLKDLNLRKNRKEAEM